METVKRKGNLGSKGDERKSVYSRPVKSKVFWQGKIERLVWGGVGLGRSEDGRAVLLSAPLALFPEEVVRASIHWKARHGEGLVDSWVQRSPRRSPAGCLVAEVCGGCDLWEAGSSVGELKRLMVEDLFSRALPGTPAWTWLPAPLDARRHRIQLHWDGRELGFHRRRSHQLVPVQECPVAAKVLSDAIPRLAAALGERILPTRPQRWELATGTPAGEVFAISETGRSWQLEPDGWHPSVSSIKHDHHLFRLQHAVGGFYQVSPAWAAEAFGTVLGQWNLHGDTLYDLYGGVGFFSALLGSRFARRCLVEYDATAVAWARVNLADLDLPSDCLAEDAAQWIPENLGQATDTILLDPPRAGLPPEVCERLQTARAEKLVLVGCDGASFCRDIKRLEPAWKLKSLAALDLFPLTHHVECIGLLELISAS
jgi:23S rRNA (uracil1939-C5)-methyltransferase